ncbi:Uncharacterised protein [Burkholderia pseudomallei]|nr:Uncharacterised protein [Burkholderia pseudomallei]
MHGRGRRDRGGGEWRAGLGRRLRRGEHAARGRRARVLRGRRAARVGPHARFSLREARRIGEAQLRIERLRPFDLRERLGGAAFAVEHLAVQIAGARVVRVRVDHLRELRIGALPVALRDRLLDLLQRRHRRVRGGRQEDQRQSDGCEKLFHDRFGRSARLLADVRGAAAGASNARAAAAAKRRLAEPPLLRRRVQLLFQRFEAVLDGRPLVQRRELVVERAAAVRIG